MRRLLGPTIFVCLAVLVLGGSAHASPDDVEVVDGRLTDDLGRRVVLRGFNAIDKWQRSGTDADLPPDLTDADLDRIAGLGANVLRLGTSWAAIEPAPGDYDDAYIDDFRDVMDAAGDRGLLVVVDMHQDVWSEQIGSNGAPAWADPGCNVPPRLPMSATTGQWWAQYFSPDSMVAFANFWADGAGGAFCTGPIQTRFVKMWGYLASRLGDHPALAGYDLFNEPWPGTPPGVFEVAQLYPFYERVAEAIRTGDPDTPIFFEPPIQRSAMLPAVPAGPPDPNAVYAPHLYTETMYTDGQVSTDGLTDEIVLREDLRDAELMGVPTWIGEWGAFENEASNDYQREVYALLDRYRVGGAYWQYTQGGSGGLKSLGPDAVTGHLRAYAEAYPARGHASWTFDPDTRTFRMTVAGPEPDAPVSIVAPSRLYPEGVSIGGAGTTTYDATRGRITWTPRGPGRSTLRVTPAS